jgi:tetratricopeptide (TPR) repeat protein
VLRWIHTEFWTYHRVISLVALIYFVLPMLAFIPVPDEKVGAVSTLSRMDVWMLRGQRVGLLLLCVFLALNPIVGPRHIMLHEMNFGLPLLSLDYLYGLAAGFLVGKLILLHGEDFTRRRRTGWQIELRVSRAVFPILTVVCAAIVLILIVRNGPAVLRVNRNRLADFGELTWRSLPANGGILLGDFPEKLMVFQAAQARHTGQLTWLPVDVKALPTPEYRARLERLRPGLWLASTNRHNLTQPEMVRQVALLVKHGRVFYQHPSNGYFGEAFYLQPAGSVYEIKEYGTNEVNLPPVPEEVIAQTAKTWDDFAPQLAALQQAGGEDPVWAQELQKALLLEPVPFGQLAVLKEWYSLALNGWGVDLQRSGHLPEAGRQFAQALALNPENWIAGINLTVNSNLQSKTEMTKAESDDLAQKVGDLVTIQKLGNEMNLFGPIDEPTVRLMLGKFFEEQKEPRLAYQEFSRAVALAPAALAPQFAFATLLVRYHLFDQAQQSFNRLHAEINAGNVDPEWDQQVSLLEARFWLSQTNRANARNLLATVADKYGKQPNVLDRVGETYLEFDDVTDAEPVMQAELAANPDDQAALLNQSRVFIMTDRAGAAIPVLDHLLSLTNVPEARFNRAQAYMMTKNFDAAKADYLELQNKPVNQLFVTLNLGRIALQAHDTNQAIRYYSGFLSNTPAGSVPWQAVSNQLHALGAHGF